MDDTCKCGDCGEVFEGTPYEPCPRCQSDYVNWWGEIEREADERAAKADHDYKMRKDK